MRRALLAAVAVTSLFAAAPARALQEAPSEPEPPSPFIRVDSISPWVDDRRPFRLRVQIANTTELPLTGVAVQAAFSPRVITRSELRAAIDGGAPCCAFLTFERTLDEAIEPGGQRVIELREPVAGRITTRGPYPVAITVSHAGGEQRFTTAVPYFAPSEAGPLRVSWILPVEASTTPDPSGSVAAADVSRVTELLSIVADRAPAPLTLAPSPALVDALRTRDEEGDVDARAAIATLSRAAATAAELATTTYAPADLPALHAQGPEGEILRQVTAGRSTITRVTGREPALDAFYPAGLSLDRGSLDELTPLGIGGVAVAPTAAREPPVEPAKLEPSKFGAIFPFRLGRERTPALFPDDALQERVLTSGDGVLLGQAIIAETIGVWQELPLYAPERVVLIAAAPAVPAALATALDGLASAPWVTMTPFAEALRAVPAVDRVAAARTEPVERSFLDGVRIARSELDVLTQIALDTPQELAELEQGVLLAASDAWLTDPDRGETLAASVTSRVASMFDAIRVADRRITLTSRTGDAPLTVVNGNDFDVRARMRLLGAKVTFPEGSFRVIDLTAGDNTFSFPVVVRATGSFPIEVVIETADGRRRLSSGTLLVRSTAVSAVSLIVVGGSALILLVGVIRRSARRNGARAKRGRAAAAR